MNSSSELDHLLDEVITLPSLPSTVGKITKLIDDPNATVQEVGKLIATDTALALKTLRLVNSAYYGVREKISTVDHATVLLGMKVIKNMVFTAAVFDTLNLGEEGLLRHNVSCGVTMKHLFELGMAESSGMESADEAFIFGLLHDAGKIVLWQYMPEEAGAILDACRDRSLTASEAEREVIGVDHAEIGARLARNWKLSEALVDGIAAHHDLSKCVSPGHRVAAALLCVADYVCYEAGIPAYEGAHTSVSDEVWEVTALSAEDVAPIVEKLLESEEDIKLLLDLAS